LLLHAGGIPKEAADVKICADCREPWPDDCVCPDEDDEQEDDTESPS